MSIAINPRSQDTGRAVNAGVNKENLDVKNAEGLPGNTWRISEGSRGNEMEARSNLGINNPICIILIPLPAFALTIFRSRTFFLGSEIFRIAIMFTPAMQR